MQKLTRADLLSLEQYAGQRQEFRARVMEHKKHRRVALGEHISLLFEDRLTIQYQVQEMLRVERIFEAQGIEDELQAYNPLIPDGANLKATMLIEYDDVGERKRALGELIGIEDKVWIRMGHLDVVHPIADEDTEAGDGGENRVGAFPALRVYAGDDHRCQQRRADRYRSRSLPLQRHGRSFAGRDPAGTGGGF